MAIAAINFDKREGTESQSETAADQNVVADRAGHALPN